LGINYIGLIPYIVSAIQEQQDMIEKQSKMIEDLSLINQSNPIDGIPQIVILFPNPTSQGFEIQITNTIPDDNVSIVIYTKDGIIIKTENMSNQTATIDTSDLVEGIYLVALNVNGTTYDIKRLIINN